jgi:hypothetical protein
MRTKTLLLSALLGALGSVSMQAQTNVYSLNVVGYVNVTLYPGYNMITCPLIASPDNTINTLFNNSGGAFNGDSIYIFQNGVGYSLITEGRAGSWNNGGGTNSILPGQAVFYFNHNSTNETNAFVGTVPSGSLTNTLVPGYNLVGSIVPTSGDLYSNSISALSNTTPNVGDLLYVFQAPIQSYTNAYKVVNLAVAHNGTSPWQESQGGDPIISTPGEGFFYFNSSTTASIEWVENYSVSQ